MQHSGVIGFFMFALGAMAGSFTNVLIWRLPRKESVVFPGSHCPVCGASIKFYDNIPILSYILLRGKCRRCKCRISPRYILVEALMGVSFLAVYLLFSPNEYVSIIRMILVLPPFIAIAFIDWQHWIIPDELTIAIAIVGIATAPVVGGWESMLDIFIGGAIGIAFFWLVAKIGKRAFGREALGEGDIILLGAVGLLVGWKGVLLTTFLAATMGTIAGLIIIAIRKTKNHSKNISLIPFGPFIVLATIITMVAGDKMIRAYLSLLM